MKQTIIIASLLALLLACKDKKSTVQETKIQEVTTPPVAMNDQGKKPFEYSKEVMWYTLDEALEMQGAVPKPIMMDVYTQWCGPCKMLTKNTFGDERVALYLNQHYYCVKFDAESPEPINYGGNNYTNPDYKPNTPGRNGVHQFTKHLNVSGYPTLFFFDKNAKEIGPVVGYKTPAQIELFLHYFAEEKHLTVQTPEQWAEYEKGFVVTWN